MSGVGPGSCCMFILVWTYNHNETDIHSYNVMRCEWSLYQMVPITMYVCSTVVQLCTVRVPIVVGCHLYEPFVYCCDGFLAPPRTLPFSPSPLSFPPPPPLPPSSSTSLLLPILHCLLLLFHLLLPYLCSLWPNH